MTPTPWKVDDETDPKEELYIVSDGIPDSFFCLANLYCNPMDDETKANAAAIVSAVNNTYGKGINPESVPDLLSALHGMLNIGNALATGHESWIDERRANAKAAIEKATIKP